MTTYYSHSPIGASEMSDESDGSAIKRLRDALHRSGLNDDEIKSILAACMAEVVQNALEQITADEKREPLKFIWPFPDGSAVECAEGHTHKRQIMFAAPKPLKILSVSDGVVTNLSVYERKMFIGPAAGVSIHITHDNKVMISDYFGLCKVHCKKGQEVKQGEAIGTAKAGDSVIFSLRRGDVKLDLTKYMPERSDLPEVMSPGDSQLLKKFIE